MENQVQGSKENPKVNQAGPIGEIPKVNLRDHKANRPRAPKMNGTVDISFKTCSQAISNVNLSRRGLLAMEIAVGLVVFTDSGVANVAAKRMLSEVYQRAGYECEAGQRDYKSVRRRIDAAAGMFGKIGTDVLTKWMSGKSETRLINAVAQEVAKLSFNSMDDVLDYLGRKSNRTAKKAGAKDTPYDIEVGKGRMVHIPKSLSEGELFELAQKILVLAEEVRIRDTTGERRIENMPFVSERRKPAVQSLH